MKRSTSIKKHRRRGVGTLIGAVIAIIFIVFLLNPQWFLNPDSAKDMQEITKEHFLIEGSLKISGVRLLNVVPIGAGRHLRLQVELADEVFDCIYFSCPVERLPVRRGDWIDLAFKDAQVLGDGYMVNPEGLNWFRIFMQGPAQRFPDIGALLPLLLVVRIDAGVEAGLERVLVLGIIPFIQVFPRIQLAPEHVVGAAHAGEDQASPPDVPFHLRGNLASQEAAVRVAVPRCQILRNLEEVEVLEDVVGDDSRLVRGGELGKVGNLLVGMGGHRLT